MKNIILKKKQILCIIGLWSSGIIASKGVVIIDNFNDTGLNTTSDTSYVNPNSLGGELDVNYFEGSLFTFGGTVSTSGGTLSVFNTQSTGSQNQGILTLSWDGVDGSVSPDADGLGGIDLTAGGIDNAISLDVVSGAAVQFTLKITDMNGNIGNEVDNLPGLGNNLYNFADFSGSVDFTNVGSISLDIFFNNSTRNAIEIDNIMTVPEPGVSSFAVIGLLAFLIRRR